MTYIYNQQERERNWARAKSGYFRKYWKRKKLLDPKRRATIGAIGEAAADMILTSGDLVREEGYDIVWANLKIEVKTSSFLNNGWTFHISRKQLNTSDFIFLFALSEKNTIEYQWFIPTREAKRLIKIKDSNLERFASYLVSTKMKVKKCKMCNLELEINNFRKVGKYYYYICRDCEKTSGKVARAKYKEAIAARKHEWYLKNRDRINKERRDKRAAEKK